MKIKYQKINSLKEEKMNKTNENIEEILCKIIAYFLIIIVFFHQYILEYYFFGFYSFLYYKNGLFSKNGQFSNIYIETLHTDLYDYFSNNNHLPIFIISLFVIIFTFSIFFGFLLLNNTKGLFLMQGMYIGNMKYLVMKLIILSFQPLFGIINFYSQETKIIIGLIMNIFIIICCCISFWSCLHQFGYYPNRVSNFALFFEFFVFFTSTTEIIVYLIGNRKNFVFFFVKLSIEIFNAYFFMLLFIFLKDRNDLKTFSKNLFSKSKSNMTKGGIYYYMRIYLEYQKDKTNNYLNILRILIDHVNDCKKIDCPGLNLVPNKYIKSSFAPNSVKKVKTKSEKDSLLNKSSRNTELKKENEEDNRDESNESDEETQSLKKMVKIIMIKKKKIIIVVINIMILFLLKKID
jgi:hypothetical protein